MNLPELINEACRGQAKAQQQLFEYYSDRMMVLCCRYVKNRQDAEEIMLDGFYKFFKQLNRFSYRGDAALYGWLKKIMVNECLMFLRKGNVFVMVGETGPDDHALPEEALDLLSAEEIFSLIVQLPVGYRTVFNLFIIEGMSHEEIAALLGISTGTSKSQLSKARALLQKMLIQKGIQYARQQSK
jgi:RNA polymerase sigma factor (sigma-70 family)